MAEIPAIKRRLVQQGVDVIDVGAGDADFAPPEVAVEALAHAIRDPAMSRYAFQLGLPAFREAAAAYMKRRFGVRFDPFTELHPLLGSKEGIAHLAMALLDPGDVAIVPEPGYAVYEGGTRLAGGEPYRYALTPRSGFLLEMSEIPADVVRRTKLVYLNYPNNPTAAVAPRDYLARTVEFCRRHGIVIAYDNPYCEITFDGYVAPSIFEIPGARDVAVEFHSLSKSFCMTGWRLGWAVGRSELVTALSRVKSYVDTGAFLAVQAAGAAVLHDAAAHLAPYVAQFKERRDAMLPALRAQGFEPETPRATMYIWVPLPEGLPSAAFQRPAPEPVELPPVGGTQPGRGPAGGLPRPAPVEAAPAPVSQPSPPDVGRPDSTLAASPAAVGPHLITPPQAADGRLWVLPRPALPEAVADALYGEPDLRDSVAVGRLRAMVDTLNRQLDSLQIARKPPSWTANVAGEKFGIDGSNIYIGPIRIPTAALALLGNLLPQGNYDESRRARQLADMRADLLQAARRAETMDQFRKYVKDLRARKHAEREFERRARGYTTRTRAETPVP